MTFQLFHEIMCIASGEPQELGVEVVLSLWFRNTMSPLHKIEELTNIEMVRFQSCERQMC